MGSNYQRRMGEGDHQVRTHLGISKVSSQPFLKVPPLAKARQGKPGGQCNLPSSRDKGHRASPKRTGRKGVLLHFVRSPQGLWRMEGDIRFEGPQSVPNLQEVQNADPKVHTGQHQGRRLPRLHRSHGGVPAYSHPSSTSEVPQVLLCEPTLPIPGSPIRSLLGTQSVYEGSGRSSRPPQNDSGEGPVLPRRHSDSVDLPSDGPVRPPNHHGGSPISRVLSEPQEESPEPHQEAVTPRGDYRFGPRQGLPFPGASVQHSEVGTRDTKGKDSLDSATIEAPGKDDLLSRHCTMGQTPLKETPMVSPPLSKTEPTLFTQKDQGPASHLTVTPVVDLIRDGQGDLLQGAPQDHAHDRCQSPGLGSPHTEASGPGAVEPGRPGSQYKLARTPGCTPGTSPFRSPGQGKSRSGPHRQRGNQSPYQQAGRNQILGPDAGGPGSGPVGRSKPKVSQGRTHLRGGKCSSRLSEQSNSGSRGVATGSSSVRRDLPTFRASSPGSVCLPDEHPATKVLLQVPDPGSGGSGCPPISVASTPSLCLPTASITTGNHTQDHSGKSGGDTDCSTLAQAPVVCRPHGAFDLTGVADSIRPGGSQSGQTTASRPPVAPASRMALEREGLTRQAYSSGVIAVIQASRRPSTNRIYDATWRAFEVWCSKRNLDPLSVTIPNVLDYLLEGLNKGLSPSTIRRQLAALSTVLVCDNSSPLSQHPAISAFLKGAVNTRPPVVHRYPTWDLPKVLKALVSSPFEPLNSCSLHFLSLKVAFLVAITSARRISELAALSVREDLCTFFEDRVVLRLDPSFVPKVNTIFHRAQELVLPNFCPRPSHRLEREWHMLDVRRALRHYIKRTSAFRKSEALFVSFQPSSMGRKVSSSTIGRWIRACITRAYLSQSLPVPAHITAHSTRSAAASAAWSTQASVEEICRAATWASPSAFIKHYKVDAFAGAEAAFGRRVLQQVVRVRSSQA